MVPPPDTMGEFPDFDSMTPEEQMAWLESLAKRQGVGDDQLTTSADMDIAEVSADTVVDEPGYVPFEGSRSARRMKEEAEAAAEAPSFELEPESEPEALPELDWGTPEESVEEMADLVDAMASGPESDDPMHWLDDLSAEPDADEGEFEDLFADSELADSESVWEDSMAAAPPDLPEAEEIPPAPSESAPAETASTMAGTTSEDDLLGGMDPMLFLESLAKRQGVNVNELTTSADMEVEEVSADTVVDEPGYTPFEGSRSARRMKEEAEPAAEAPEPEPAMELEPELEPEPEAPAREAEPAAESVAEGPEDAESMEWLETLAKRQGAESEELLTEAALDIPELPEDTVVDEPGYVEYSPLSILPSEDEAELPTEALAAAEEEDADLFELESADDSLAWLEDLAAEPDEEFSDMFAEFEEPVSTLEPEPEAEPEPSRAESEPATAAPSSDDPLAGLTDEDIARMQAQGQLTPHQELAWLKRQAAKLAEVHAAEEVDEAVMSDEELAPAEPGDLPPWLEQMREESEGEDAAVLAESIGELDEAELPPGLFEDIEAEVDLDVSSLALDTDELSPAEVDSLWAEPAEEAPEVEGPESELTAFLEGDLEPEADPLAEALDAEYDRKMVGDDTEPEWYTDAVAKVASEAPDVPEDSVLEASEPSAAPEVPSEPVVSAAVPVEMPDWLKEVQEETPAAEIDIPDWLEEEAEAVSAVAGDIPDWLQEQMPSIEAEAEIPDWLSEVGEEELLEEAALDWMPEEIPAAEEVETEPEPERAEAELEAAEAAPPPAPEPEAAPAPAPPPAPVSPPAAAPTAGVEPEVSAPTPAPVPQGAQFDQYRQRLEANPNDYASRLELARALRDQRQTTPSLDQYETLINASQQLQNVVNDLRELASDEAEPRVNRLLGDAYMRQGRLEEALDAYRSALNKL